MPHSGSPAVLPRRSTRGRGADALGFGGIAVQLALVLGVAHVYRIEEVHVFPTVVPLLFGGFVAHALLPMRWRRPFFVVLGLGALWGLLGLYALPVVAVGGGLIALCHLPVPLRLRAALLAAVGAAGAGYVLLGRAGLLPMRYPALVEVVPVVLASLFMFRLALYLRALALDRAAHDADVWTRLGYFFLFPNPFLPLFPVVDFGVFRRSFYRADALDVYARGVVWMARGVAHLLLYRVLYYHLLPDASAVGGALGVALWMGATFGLYLRVSGLFHLAAGILCLFGYDLPPTHRRYLLATSLPDFFRRLNVYWHDVLQATVFLPVLRRLRPRATAEGAGALVAATLATFAASALLLAWQAFWLGAEATPDATDAVFWSLVAGLTAAGLVRRRARPRRRLGPLRAGAANVAVLGIVVVLWSLWAMPSLGAWAAMLGRAAASPPAEWALLLGVLGALALLSAAARATAARAGALRPHAARLARLGYAAGALALLALPLLPLDPGAAAVADGLREDRFHQRLDDLPPRGYADELLDGSYSTALWRAYGRQPADWQHNITDTPAGERVGGLLGYRLVPNVSTRFKRAPMQTNAHGMRDAPYTLAKPPRTYRLALMGSSYEMGWAVRQDETFEARLEQRLNDAHGGRGRYHRYEVLNFAVTGYGLVQMIEQLETTVGHFEPDAVVLPIHESLFNRVLEPVLQAYHRGELIDEPYLHALAARAGLVAGAPLPELRERLVPFQEEAALWAYARIAAWSRERGIVPVWLYLPGTRVRPPGLLTVIGRLEARLEPMGYVVMRADSLYVPHGPMRYRRAPWDDHPGPEAHARMAERIYDLLLEHAGALRLDVESDADAGPGDAQSP